MLLALTGALVAGTPASLAADLHVDKSDPNCSDAGPGSSSIPYCTISRGGAVAVAGDTVSVRSGSYSENVRFTNSGTALAPIVVRAEIGANVTVTSPSRAFEVSNRSWIRIEGFTVSGTVSYGIAVIGSSRITVDGNVVTGTGAPVSGLTRPAIYVSGSTDCTISGNDLHHNSDSGVYVANGSTRILIVGNTSSFNARVYTRAAPGIDVRSGGNTIQGNICHDNEDTGVQIYGVSGTPSPDNLVVNNLCYDNGDHGIDVSSAGSQWIVGNTVYGNLTAGINVEGPSGGTVVENNISVDNAVNAGKGNIRVDGAAIPGTTIDYDLVYQSQSGQTQLVWGTSSYATLAAFAAATGQEPHGIEANPNWVAPSADDFHLAAASPAIDSADSGATGAMSTDIEGAPRIDDPTTANTGAGPRTYDDRGAFEHQISSFCGNGIREPGEVCDGADLGGESCASLGFFCGSGSGLGCDASCAYLTGSCVTGCPASDPCHLPGTCDAQTDRCTDPPAADGTACDDSNACTLTDTCQSGLCQGSSAVTCAASDTCHLAGTCDAVTGSCSNPLKVDGAPCDDGNTCTANDACLVGVCAGQSLPLPGEVDDGVQVSQSEGVSTITWNPAQDSTGSDVLRGLVSGLPVGPGGEDEACLAGGISGASTTDAADPGPDEAFWYLIKGTNACGKGSYGSQVQDGVSTPRLSRTCP